MRSSAGDAPRSLDTVFIYSYRVRTSRAASAMQPPEHHAVVHHPDRPPTLVEPAHWEAFCRGQRSLGPGVASHATDEPAIRGNERLTRAVDVLLITLRRDAVTKAPVAERVEPMRIGIDDQGYLQRLHLELAPAIDPNIVDLRPRLASRYLQRTWAWQPSAEVVQAALTLCATRGRTDVAER